MTRVLNLVAPRHHAGQLIRLGKFLGLAFIFLMLAIALVVMPDLRSDPNRITLRDLPYSIALGLGVTYGARWRLCLYQGKIATVLLVLIVC